MMRNVLAICFIVLLAVLVSGGDSVRADADCPYTDTPGIPTDTPEIPTGTPWLQTQYPSATPWDTLTYVTPTSPPEETVTPIGEPTPTDGVTPDPTASETPGAQRNPRATPTPNMVMPETGLPLLPTFFLGFALFAVAFIVGMIRRARA